MIFSNSKYTVLLISDSVLTFTQFHYMSTALSGTENGAYVHDLPSWTVLDIKTFICSLSFKLIYFHSLKL